MIDKPVTMGIIGYGHFLRSNFVRHLENCPSIKIIGVYNRGDERRRQAEQDGYFTTGSLDELLALPGLESVLIGTSNAAHKEQAVKAARAGKHILCEKPMAVNLKDAQEMAAEAKKAGVITHVNHARPFRHDMEKFREAVETYAGSIYHYYERSSRQFGTWLQGAKHVAVAYPEDSGGWTFHHLCHALNNACMFINSKVVQVYHLSQKSCPQSPGEEIVNSLLKFENGATAMLADTTSIGGFHDIIVQGAKADVRMWNGMVTVVRPGPYDPAGRPGNLSQMINSQQVGGHGKPLVAVGHKFAQAVRGGKNGLFSFESVKDQYKVMYAMKTSAETGKSVDLN